MDCRSEQTATLVARIFISLHLALVYLKSLPELGLALPMQRKKLSDACEQYLNVYVSGNFLSHWGREVVLRFVSCCCHCK